MGMVMLVPDVDGAFFYFLPNSKWWMNCLLGRTLSVATNLVGVEWLGWASGRGYLTVLNDPSGYSTFFLHLTRTWR